MKEESFDWLGKSARKTIASLLIVGAIFAGINSLRNKYNSKSIDSSIPEIKTEDNQFQPLSIRFRPLPLTQKNDLKFQTYIVKYGDTLSEIAEKYSVPMKELVYWNGIQNPNLIYEREKLRIPVRQGVK